MKEKNVSKDMIFKYMKRYRIKFLIIEFILIAVLIAYFMWCKPYIMNVFEGASGFDAQKFSADTKTVAVKDDIEVHRNDDLSIPSYTIRSWGYWQDDKYEFRIKLEDVSLTDIVYTMENTDDTGASQSKDISSKIYTATIGDKKVIIIAYPHDNFKSGDTVEGIFTKIPLVVDYDMANSESFKAGDEICEYMLDTRGLEMENEQFDTLFCAILLIIILYLAFKLIRQFVKYKTTPTYRQLEKYDDCLKVEKEISAEIEKGYTIENKQVVTESWLISKDVFKLKIVKNHMALGKFEYFKK